jgi:RNA polymerase sigma-70 factor (ECF subfamily)
LQWSWTARETEIRKNDPASSDAELAERLKQRDEHAFLSLYDLHRSSVFRFLMHMTGSITVAEELTQEVFVVILDAICAGTVGQFDPQRGTWEGYLLGIARNLARAEQRKARRLVSLDNVIETPEWERQVNTIFRDNRSPDAVSLIAARSELRLLYRAILELPEHYREAIVLCGIQEKSYREAAIILRCTEGTIASRMNRAKSLLAAKLRRSGLRTARDLTIRQGKEGTDVETAIKADRNR